MKEKILKYYFDLLYQNKEFLLRNYKEEISDNIFNNLLKKAIKATLYIFENNTNIKFQNKKENGSIIFTLVNNKYIIEKKYLPIININKLTINNNIIENYNEYIKLTKNNGFLIGKDYNNSIYKMDFTYGLDLQYCKDNEVLNDFIIEVSEEYFYILLNEEVNFEINNIKSASLNGESVVYRDFENKVGNLIKEIKMKYKDLFNLYKVETQFYIF